MPYKILNDIDFIKESNKIEGILRAPTVKEKREFLEFMTLEDISIADMQKFVSVYQPNAVLRSRAGLDVRIGNYYPPKGSMSIVYKLEAILEEANLHKHNKEQAFLIHSAYESLHPFTDGNGRSGRMLWRWMMPEAPLGFLHSWYYQSLAYGRNSEEFLWRNHLLNGESK